MSEIITLYCWIRGTSIDQLSDIKISRSENVGDLKRLLKESQAIDAPAPALRLYKPKDPVAEPHDENLRKVLLCDLGKPLPASRKLSTLFKTAPPEEHIHIIVDAPRFVIHCWLRGTTTEEGFNVSIGWDAALGDLKDKMKEKEPRLKDTNNDRIRLYRISDSEDELRESLDTLNAGELLETGRSITLSERFLHVPVLQRLHIVVQVYSDNNRSTNPPLRVNRVIGGEDRIKTARESFLADMDDHSKKSKRSQSPSSGSHPSSFRERQGNQKLQIACGRPRELDETIPTTLLHPVFGQFIDDSRTHTITEEDNRLVDELANVMSALHGTENERIDAVSKVLAGYGLSFLVKRKVKGTAYETDAGMSVDVRNNRHPFVIAEFKNEAATSSSEPYMQALAYYLESTRGFASKMTGCALPCFLLIIFGPYVVFAGAVWTLRPAAQILSSPLAFNYHCTDTDSQMAAARHMAAFRKSARALERYYETLAPESELVNKLGHPILFPYPKSFKSLEDDRETGFEYTEQLEEEDGMPKRLIFFGTVSDGRADAGICIKFVRHYSREAHLHCALSGAAPRLLGFEELAGGWYMVVMEKIVGYEVLADLPDTERLPRSVFEEIGEQLKRLHAGQLVHGDIRDTNIMVKKDDRTKFMIIDFDWAGVEEATRYPAYVNYSKIKRPEEARDGLPVKAAHDHAMLDVIMEERAMKD